MDVSVLGGGRMAAAYAATLEAGGVSVSTDSGRLAPVILTAFFSGKQTRGFLEAGQIADQTTIIDLATQEVADAQACGLMAQRTRTMYVAGGVTGGVRQVGTDDFMILLGGSSIDDALPDWLSLLGSVKTFNTVEQAVSAKLLHNLALVLINYTLGVTLGLARRAGIPDMLHILADGTAGRPIRAASTVRDWVAVPSSSYVSELVAKDLRAMLASFPELAGLDGINLDRLAECYAAYGSEPYTIVPDRMLSE